MTSVPDPARRRKRTPKSGRSDRVVATIAGGSIGLASAIACALIVWVGLRRFGTFALMTRLSESIPGLRERLIIVAVSGLAFMLAGAYQGYRLGDEKMMDWFEGLWGRRRDSGF